MFAVISLLVIVMISLTVTRIASLALTHTGLPREVSRFQARSAFTGVGFTTTEAEKVVSHPVRRRIVLLLMLLGNAGFVTAVSTLILGFVDDGSRSVNVYVKIVLLVSGLVILWIIAQSQWVDRQLTWLVDWALARFTKLDVTDFYSLMHLAGEYRIVELRIDPEDWLADKSLRQSRLRDEGILVLGIQRAGGNYLGAPTPETCIQPNDNLLLYGRVSALEELDRRRSGLTGDREHEEAVAKQGKVEEEELKEDLPRGLDDA